LMFPSSLVRHQFERHDLKREKKKKKEEKQLLFVLSSYLFTFLFFNKKICIFKVRHYHGSSIFNKPSNPITIARTAKTTTQASFLVVVVVGQAPGVGVSVIIRVGWVQRQLLKLFMREDHWCVLITSLEHTMIRFRHSFFLLIVCYTRCFFFFKEERRRKLLLLFFLTIIFCLLLICSHFLFNKKCV